MNSRLVAGLDAVLAFPLLAVVVLYLAAAAAARPPESPRPRPQLAMCPGPLANPDGVRLWGLCREVEADRQWSL